MLLPEETSVSPFATPLPRDQAFPARAALRWHFIALSGKRGKHVRTSRTSVRQLMPVLMCLTMVFAPVQSAAFTSVVANVVAAYSLNAQLGRYSVSGLTSATVQARMAEMETLLGDSGYGHRFSRAWTDGTLYARWYDPGGDTTVVMLGIPSIGQSYTLDVYTVNGPITD